MPAAARRGSGFCRLGGGSFRLPGRIHRQLLAPEPKEELPNEIRSCLVAMLTSSAFGASSATIPAIFDRRLAGAAFGLQGRLS